MAYSSNYKPVLAETGEYEATLINADVRTAGNGSQYLNIAFNLDSNIRVYDKIWRDAVVPTDFNHQRVADLLLALNINDELEDDFALIQAIKNKKCIVSVVKEFNDKTQKEVNNIKEYKQLQDINITDEDLPF